MVPLTGVATPADHALQRRTVGTLVGSQMLGGVGVSSGIAVGSLLAEQILGSPDLAGLGGTFQVLGSALIAVPILFQVYMNAALTYELMRRWRVSHAVAAPGALIGASNFFELAVATAIALFGPESGAALATVVGVLVEVPVMLSVCRFCNATRLWFAKEALA